MIQGDNCSLPKEEVLGDQVPLGIQGNFVEKGGLVWYLKDKKQ